MITLCHHVVPIFAPQVPFVMSRATSAVPIMGSEQPSTFMWLQKTVLVGAALALCSGFICFATINSVNSVSPAQSLYSSVAVPQSALRTISVAPARGLAPLQNVPSSMNLAQPSGCTRVSETMCMQQICLVIPLGSARCPYYPPLSLRHWWVTSGVLELETNCT